MPPGNSTNGWGWSNILGEGVYANVIPQITVPDFMAGDTLVEDFQWTIPPDFCASNPGGTYYITGILNPPPDGTCPEIFTDVFAFDITCPSVSLSGGGDLCPGNCPDDTGMLQVDFAGGQSPYTVDLLATVDGFPDEQINGLTFPGNAALSICVEGNFPFYDMPTQTLFIPESSAGSTVTISLTGMQDANSCSGQLNGTPITVNILEPPQAMASTELTVCTGNAVQLDGGTGGTGSGIWMTAGDGSFDNAASGNALYTPGAQDVLNGSVILKWIVNDPGTNCTPDTAETTITILDAAEITLPASQEICSDGDAMLNASINVTGWDIDWSTTGDGTFDDPNSLVTAYLPGPGDIVSGTVSLTVLASDPSGLCPPDMATQIVSIQQEITVDSPGPIEICEGEEAMLFPVIDGNYQTVIWTTDGDGTFGNPNNEITSYLPGPDDITSGTVNLTISVSNPAGQCPPETAVQEVVIRQAISVDLPAIVEICSDGEVMLVPAIDGNYQSLLWETSGDGTFGNPNNEITNYLPGPNDISSGTVNLMITVNDPDGPCPPDMAMQEVNIQQAISIDLPGTIGICADEIAMLIPTINGQYDHVAWVSNGDGVFDDPASVATNYMPGPNDILAGSIELELLVTNLSAVCPDTSAFVTIVIDDCSCPPLSVLAPEDPLCSNQGSTLDLNSLEINTDPGSWAITSPPAGTSPAQITGSFFNADGADPGTYEITFSLLNPVAGCPADTAVSLQVSQAPSIRIISVPAYCDPDLIEVVTDISGGPGLVWWETTGEGSFLADSTLSNIYIPGVNDPQSGAFDIIAFIQDSAGVCPVNSDTLNTMINLPPFAIFDTLLLSTCNDAASGSVLDIGAILTGGDINGSWSVGTGPPIDLGDISAVDFDGIPPGNIILEYTTGSAIPPCTDTTYQVTVQVIDCACPPLVAAPSPTAICATDTLLNLAPLVAGSDPGAWALKRIEGTGDLPVISLDTLYVTPATTGLFELTFTLLAAPIDGCPDSVVFELRINGQPEITLPGDTVVCADSQVEITALVAGPGLAGAWSNGTGDGSFTMPGTANTIYQPGPGDLSNGSVRLFYTVMDTSSTCPPVSDSLQVMFADTAFVEFLVDEATVCNMADSGSVLDLSTFIGAGDMNGVWADVDNSGADLSNLPVVDFDGINTGMYRFVYETNSAMPPCSEKVFSFEVNVEDCACPSVALAISDTTVCRQSDSLDLDRFLITGEEGDWNITGVPAGNSPATLTGESVFQFSEADTGKYELSYVLVDSVDGCPVSGSLVIDVQAPPAASITFIECGDDLSTYTVIITTDGVNPQASAGVVSMPMPGVYEITDIPLSQTLVFEVTRAAAGCVTSVVVSPPDCDCTLAFEFSAMDASCFGAADGQIVIDTFMGAVGPVCISVEGDTCVDAGEPPYLIDGLTAGNVLVALRDSIGCLAESEIRIGEPEQIIANLGPDLVIEAGDTVTINPILNFIPASWTYAPPVLPLVSINGSFVPETSLSVSFVVQDTNNCETTDQLFIEVTQPPPGTDIVFVPNVFTPNQDQRNDFFYIQSNEIVERISLFRIYDRWGQIVFEQTDFPPNIPSIGWDGNVNGSPALTGVYVYQIEYATGEEQVVLKGDVTLIR